MFLKIMDEIGQASKKKKKNNKVEPEEHRNNNFDSMAIANATPTEISSLISKRHEMQQHE